MDESINFGKLTIHFQDCSVEHSKLVSLVRVLASFVPVKNKEISFSLLVVDSIKMRSVNKQHRGKDKATDVLSFPLQSNVKDKDYDKAFPFLELGDVLVCHEVCSSQAIDHQIEYDSEFIHLAIHGFLHLLGYDHELGEAEQFLMEKKEEELLELFSKDIKG